MGVKTSSIFPTTFILLTSFLNNNFVKYENYFFSALPVKSLNQQIQESSEFTLYTFITTLGKN